MNTLFVPCKEIFEKKNSFVLTTHINPDGDALGSEVALALYLRSRGKLVTVINQSETPTYYAFMNSLFPIDTFVPEKHVRTIVEAGAFIALDSNSPKRFHALEEPLSKSSAYKICIDHHLDREPFADLYVIDESASATGEIIFNLLKYLDAKAITPPIAEALYAAIMTDTGSFRFPKTDPETHRTVAELLECGADPTSIYQKIFEEGSAGRLKLLGRALDSLTLWHDGAIASITLRRADFDDTGTSDEDTDNMINYTLSIGGVKVGLMFTEMHNCVKVSFRSKGSIPINQLAKEFRGNGHMNAAGARIFDTALGDVVTRVVARAADYAR